VPISARESTLFSINQSSNALAQMAHGITMFGHGFHLQSIDLEMHKARQNKTRQEQEQVRNNTTVSAASGGGGGGGE
jgi:hypothetical protein